MTTQARLSHAFEAQLGETPIRMLMSASPACVAGHRTLADAWALMQEQLSTRRLGAAIVVEHGQVQGVFTTTDTLSILRGLLEGTVSLG
jgi:CBS domain-containing protein